MDYLSDLENYKESIKQKGDQLIEKGLLEKMALLSDLLRTPPFAKKNLRQQFNLRILPKEPRRKRTRLSVAIARNAPPTTAANKKYIWATCNDDVTTIEEMVKPHLWALLNDMDLLKMWVVFQTAKIEGGNGLGVHVQKKALEEFGQVARKAKTFFKAIALYHLKRAQTLAKIAENPEVADLRQAVKEMDEKQLHAAIMLVGEMRDKYCFLYNFILRNVEKIKNPRFNDPESSLY